MAEPFEIPLFAKYGIYAFSCASIYYVYNTYDIGGINLTDKLKDFSFTTEEDIRVKIQRERDKLFDTKGNRKGTLQRGEHISAKDGLGDSVRNKDKSSRLKIQVNGSIVLQGPNPLLFNEFAGNGTEHFLLLNDGGFLKVFTRTGHTNGIGNWKVIGKFIDYPIDYLEVSDDNHLNAYSNGVLVWQDGKDITPPSPPPDCDVLDNLEDETITTFKEFNMKIKNQLNNNGVVNPPPRQLNLNDVATFDYEVVEQPLKF